MTPLMMAVIESNVEIVMLLLNNENINIEMTDDIYSFFFDKVLLITYDYYLFFDGESQLNWPRIQK